MSSLPSSDADRLVTRDDLAELRTELKTDFRDLLARFDRLEDRIHTMFQTFVRTTVYSMVALTGIFSVVMTLIWAQ